MSQLLKKYTMLTTNEGRMESMSQLLKKSALLAVCAALALCFTTQSAQAQVVEPGGTGEHLFFAYWSTANYTNTNVNIHSPLGVTGGLPSQKCCLRQSSEHSAGPKCRGLFQYLPHARRLLDGHALLRGPHGRRPRRM